MILSLRVVNDKAGEVQTIGEGIGGMRKRALNPLRGGRRAAKAARR